MQALLSTLSSFLVLARGALIELELIRFLDEPEDKHETNSQMQTSFKSVPGNGIRNEMSILVQHVDRTLRSEP